jgi:hypothetical protein
MSKVRTTVTLDPLVLKRVVMQMAKDKRSSISNTFEVLLSEACEAREKRQRGK